MNKAVIASRDDLLDQIFNGLCSITNPLIIRLLAEKLLKSGKSVTVGECTSSKHNTNKALEISYDSFFKKGNSNILEVPISSALLPYIGTTMRISPGITKFIEKFLFMDSAKTDKPIVFLFHPNECLDVVKRVIFTRRTKNPFKYLFAYLLLLQIIKKGERA